MIKKIGILLFFVSTSLLGLSLLSKFSLAHTAAILKTITYQELWKRVDSCENKGLTESALKTVLQVYDKAKAENNSAQFVKAVIYKLKFTQYKEEFSTEKNIAELKTEVESSQFPVKAVLQSILAEAYWQYYQNNRWRFYNRSTTINFNKEDVATFSIKDLVNACLLNFKLSLKEKNSLQHTTLEPFEELIIPGTKITRNWRPTLYDFLAHRALDFYKNSEAEVTKAAKQFSLNEPEYLKPYPEFLNYKITAPADSLDFHYYCVLLFQELEQFQLNSTNSEGLADLELERLEYFYQNSTAQNKDSVYLKSCDWLSQHFSKSPRIAEIAYLKAEWEYAQSSSYRALGDSTHKWNKKRALAICENIIAAYPKLRGAQLATNLKNNIELKTLAVTCESVNDPALPNRVLTNYSNVPKLYFKVVKTNYFDYQKLSGKYYGKELYKALLNLNEVIRFEQNLPDDRDYNTHRVEIKIPPLEAGFYVLITGTSKDFAFKDNLFSYQPYQVSNIAYLNQTKKQGESVFYVVNRQSGQALNGVKAQLWYFAYDSKSKAYGYQKGNSYESNEQGNFVIADIERNYRNYQIEFSLGKDHLFSSTNFYPYRETEQETNEVRSFIFTDRAIYRPGQTVYFKSILLKGRNNNFDLLTKHPVTLTFYDVYHQKVSSQDLVSNDFGTVSGSFTAPQGVLSGQMSISDNISTKYFSVEEYKRPKFETKFDTLKGEYQLNDTVQVKGVAKAYAGNTIDGAAVNYRVVRSINYPYWWYWYRPYFSRSTEVEITNGSTTSNEKGEYSISFVALPDQSSTKKDNPVYTYEIFADVTDINGETHSTSTLFRAGYKSLELNFNCPETINREALPKLSFTALNLNGVEERAKGQLSVYQLNSPDKVFRKRLWDQPDKYIYSRDEYYKLFPNDLYADELNQYTWQRSKKIFSRNFDTGSDKDIEVKEFKNLSAGIYLAESICKDKNGEEVKAINYITVYAPSGTELPYKMAQWDYALKTSAEPGEKGAFILASSYADVHCLFEVADKAGNTISVINPSLKTIEVPITEEQRGGVALSTRFVKYGRFYSSSHFIQVPFTNKQLDISYSTFRNKLIPGQAEEWTLSIKNNKGEKVVAELLAGMYDASLDAFTTHTWPFSIYQPLYLRTSWQHSLEDLSRAFFYSGIQKEYVPAELFRYDVLNYFGLGFYNSQNYSQIEVSSSGGRGRPRRTKQKAGELYSLQETAAAPAEAMRADADAKSGNTIAREELSEVKKEVPKTQPTNISQVKARSNFNETAFFYPNLYTNENGDVLIKFTMPESLTRWKFMAFAHTKDLRYGFSENECVTQKELMLVPNAPRFLRENDEMTLMAKVSNLSANELKGTAELKFYDAFSDKDVTALFLSPANSLLPFKVSKNGSTNLEWSIKIPETIQAVKYKIVAAAGNFSDGEEMVLPVMANRMLVTESMPLPIRGNQSKEFSFTKFIYQNNHSTTLKNQAYTLEFTANPAWYAVQSLPYLMEYPYECAEQTFSRYYANALATHIANSKPKIKQIFDSWKTSSPESFLSNLEKNQDLKALLLQETPWLLDAKNESENKKRVGLLFDLNKMSRELTTAINALEKMQSSNGAWPWFSGCPEDRYITQHILSGLAHLRKLGVNPPENKQQIDAMIAKAIEFCDEQLKKDFELMKRYNANYRSENHLDYMAIQYLYMRSYFKEVAIPFKSREAFDYYQKQAKTYWLSNSRYLQGMLALATYRFDDKTTASSIMRSLKENALKSEEMGMYWKENYGYYWYQAPIEAQALMIEAFDEVTNDLTAVDDLKTWLIKSKQTQHWGSTKATTEAVYALLLRGTDWLSTEPNVEISLGPIQLNPKTDASLKAEAGTGYFKITYTGTDIQPEMGKVKVTKKDAGVSWGAVYWQYFEQLDKITTHETPLKLSKKLFVQRNTPSGPVIEVITETTPVKIGDKLKVRIELRVDRDMEYVHLKDMRAAGLEPVNVISSYKYQDGLGYYESTADATTNFFISYLPKGNYVFEYPLLVSHAGNFSNGISSIQCMYAPEFTSHSEGLRIKMTK